MPILIFLEIYRQIDLSEAIGQEIGSDPNGAWPGKKLDLELQKKPLALDITSANRAEAAVVANPTFSYPLDASPGYSVRLPSRRRDS